MEKRINKKVETYIGDFKNDIRKKLESYENYQSGHINMNDFLEFIYDYDRLAITKEDLSKRKRLKNSIPSNNRCNAKRATGEQCTRRRKENCEFCGTHMKGVPNGLIHLDESGDVQMKKMEVFAQEICGITYYIDNNSNVYNTEDIMKACENPRIVGKYDLKDGTYSIPAFGI
jgi:hypothetical protein